MKKSIKKSSINAFTLIELVVAITIFSIIMISVISIFLFSSELSGKIEINRTMQENIKNVVETIAEDVRKNGLVGVSPDSTSPCSRESGDFVIGSKLCTAQFEYYLAKENISGGFTRVSNPSSPDAGCTKIQDMCRIVKEDKLLVSITPLSNNFVTFRSFSFALFGGKIPYVSIHARLQPASGKGVRSNLIEESEMIFQTSLSERMIDIN